jgi:Fe2+ or Zn2+ uptake regulation protein
MTHPHEHRHDVPATAAPLLRGRGRRVTRQRTLIWNALVGSGDEHLSAADVVARVRVDLPSVSPSTVYRTLDLLVEEGLVSRTDLGTGSAVYEPVRRHRHHHLVCDRCGRVEHVHDDALAGLASHLRAQSGFELGTAELTLHGRCVDCA